MSDIQQLEENEWVLRLGNGTKVVAKAKGQVRLILDSLSILLEDVLFVPEIVKNIISISTLENIWFSFNISNGIFYVLKNGSSHILGTLQNGLYYTSNNNILTMKQDNKHKSSDQNSVIL